MCVKRTVREQDWQLFLLPFYNSKYTNKYYYIKFNFSIFINVYRGRKAIMKATTLNRI